MRRFLRALLLCAVLASCSESHVFTVKGSLIRSFYGDGIYLCDFFSHDTLASGRFTDSTSFIMEGNVPAPTAVYLKSASQRTSTAFVLEPGDIEVRQVNDTLFLVSGTPLNDEYLQFMGRTQFQPGDSVDAGIRELVLEHQGDALGRMLWRGLAYSLDAQEYVDFYELLSEEMKSDSLYVRLYERSQRQLLSLGAMFSEIAGKVDGRSARLSDYAGRGSWVLLHFWAGWCGDCAAEMPALRELYDSLSREGVRFVGVAGNDDSESVERAIRRHGIVWPVITDTNGRESYSYGIVTIPTYVLINPEGVIVDRTTACSNLPARIREAMSR